MAKKTLEAEVKLTINQSGTAQVQSEINKIVQTAQKANQSAAGSAIAAGGNGAALAESTWLVGSGRGITRASRAAAGVTAATVAASSGVSAGVTGGLAVAAAPAATIAGTMAAGITKAENDARRMTAATAQLVIDPKSADSIKKSLNDISGGFDKVAAAAEVARSNVGEFSSVSAKMGETMYQQAEDQKKSVDEVVKASYGAKNPMRDEVMKGVEQYESVLEASENALTGLSKTQKQATEAQAAGSKVTKQQALDLTTMAGRAKEAQKEFGPMISMSRSLSRFAMPLALAGGALVAPAYMAMNKYQSYSGIADTSSRAWLNTSKELEQSQMRIGRVVQQQLAPAYKQMADTLNQVASFIEKHPDLAKGALGVGGALVGMAGIVKAVDMLTILVGYGGKLGQTLGLTKAAGVVGTSGFGGAAAGAAGGAGGNLPFLLNPITGGVMIGALGYSVLAKSMGLPSIGTMAAQGATSLAYGGAKATGVISGASTSEANKQAAAFTVTIGLLTHAFTDAQAQSILAANGIESVADAASKVPSGQALQAYISYTKQNIEAEKNYSRQRSQIIRQYGIERAQIETEYERQRTLAVQEFARSQAQAQSDFAWSQARAVRDFGHQEQRTEEEYYRERTKAAKTHNLEVQRAEEDHQRRMKEMLDQHNFTMEDLTDSRDALAAYREIRNYEYQRSTEEANYQIESARRNQDWATQLKDMEINFAIQRKQRLDDYKLQMADQQADFARQQATAKANFEYQQGIQEQQHQVQLQQQERQHNETLRQLDVDYALEREKIRQEFIDQLTQMKEINGQLADQFYGAMEDRYKLFVKNIDGILPDYMTKALGKTPGKAGGGYAGYGLYNLGEAGTEYVLDANTTRYVEQALGGPLSQAKIIQMLGGGLRRGGGRGNATINQNYRFESSMSEAERRWFRQVARFEAENGLMNVIGA